MNETTTAAMSSSFDETIANLDAINQYLESGSNLTTTTTIPDPNFFRTISPTNILPVVSSMLLDNTTTTIHSNNNTNNDNNDDDLVGISAYFVLFSSLLALVLILSKFLHDHPRIATIFPEAGMILTVGMIAGYVVNSLLVSDEDKIIDPTKVDVENILQFSPQVFFIFLLPPIIFNSGYHLRREIFFRHIVPICLFAIAGTTISAVVIAIVLQFVQSIGWTESTFQPRTLKKRRNF